jgi:hypothetical protein
LRIFPTSEFPHRSNKDGTIDSICPHCFIKIGTATWEVDLERTEADHVCDRERLQYFQRELRNMPATVNSRHSERNAATVACVVLKSAGLVRVERKSLTR